MLTRIICCLVLVASLFHSMNSFRSHKLGHLHRFNIKSLRAVDDNGQSSVNNTDHSTQVLCAKRASIPIDVEEGKSYYWCSCGRSKNQPFCDGSHAGTSFKPVVYKATKSSKVFFCQCKQGKKQPLCDGSHKSLPEDAEGKYFDPILTNN